MEFLKWVPKNVLSRIVGRAVEAESPGPIARATRDWFIKRYKINMNEAELPLEAYPCVAKLFTRKLKPGIRPIGSGVVHPCDSVLTTVEKIGSDTLIQAKGRSYSLGALLADPTLAASYQGGWHLVYYLCPTDYHRVHSPIDGEIEKVTYIPGYLWPVNSWSVNGIDSLFAVNERVVVWIRSQGKLVALVMVGATNVGMMTMSFDPEIRSNMRGSSKKVLNKKYEKPLSIRKGDEVGIFNMGSTVVMLYPPGFIDHEPKKGPTRLGESV